MLFLETARNLSHDASEEVGWGRGLGNEDANAQLGGLKGREGRREDSVEQERKREKRTRETPREAPADLLGCRLRRAPTQHPEKSSRENTQFPDVARGNTQNSELLLRNKKILRAPSQKNKNPDALLETCSTKCWSEIFLRIRPQS